MAEPEDDIHNFSTSSSHRLPTISGAEALQNALKKSRGVSTGLESLDASLTTSRIRRGHVTEIYGPPGVGKTSFGLELTASVLQSGTEDRVAWVDCGFPLFVPRLHQFLARPGHEGIVPTATVPEAAEDDLLRRFSYIDIRSLPRLLTLLIHPPSGFPHPNTTLLIIDDLSTLLLSAFPRTKSKTPQDLLSSRSASKATTRRFQTIESIAIALSKLAALHNIAIVILTPVTTSFKPGHRATLKPAITAQSWDAVIRTRILLYRDFCPNDVDEELTKEEKSGVRFAEVVKQDGREVFIAAVSYIIQDHGLREIRTLKKAGEEQKPDMSLPGSISQPQKPLPLLSQEYVDEGSKGLDLPSDPQLQKPVPTLSQEEQSDVPKGLELPSDPALLTQTVVRQGKRKAVEIADSDGEEEIVSTQGEEPTLPEVLEQHREEESEDEMLLGQEDA